MAEAKHQFRRFWVGELWTAVHEKDLAMYIPIERRDLSGNGDLLAEFQELDEIHRSNKQVQAGITRVRAIDATKAQIDASELPSEK